MSIIIEIFPQCDECGETYADDKYTTVTACRNNMRDGGWKTRHGKDICCSCAEKASNTTNQQRKSIHL